MYAKGVSGGGPVHRVIARTNGTVKALEAMGSKMAVAVAEVVLTVLCQPQHVYHVDRRSGRPQ